jgi:hypothetical protein
MLETGRFGTINELAAAKINSSYVSRVLTGGSRRVWPSSPRNSLPPISSGSVFA